MALAVYGRVGDPDLPDAPLASRRIDLDAPGGIDAAVAQIEAHLIKAPDDRRGWEVLAPVYMRLGRFADAASAYHQAIRLGDDAPLLRAEFGEALVAMADGVVTADARAEFDRARDLPMAKFYLALAAEQDGKTEAAKAAYSALAPAAKGDAPWMRGLRARLAALGGDAAQADFAPQQRKMIEGMVHGLADRLASKGGNAEEWGRLIRAYSALAPAAKGGAPWMRGLRARLAALDGGTAAAQAAFPPEQRKMIEGMVQGLADRLASQGGDAAEWGRLIRAYSVLHEPDKARDALASARKALGPNADIDALARELRL